MQQFYQQEHNERPFLPCLKLPSSQHRSAFPVLLDPSSIPEDSDSLKEAIKLCFTDWHGETARKWQVEACKEVLWRHTCRLSTPPTPMRPLLLVRSTGGGKSAVRDVSGFLCGGITLTIVPLLSLSADQTSKLSQLSAKQQLSGRLHVFNLDIIRTKSLNATLRENLKRLSPDGKTRVSLFSSPQKLSQDPLWQQTVRTCFQKGILRCIAVDECHLYASHGREFRLEFSELKRLLFQVANHRTKLPIPVLFMTATPSPLMLHDLQKLTSLSFHPITDLIWPHHHSGVHRRNISLDITFQDSPLRRVKREVVKMCKQPGCRKIMIYSNSRKAIIRLYEQNRDNLNLLGIEKDLVLVHGHMYREQKFHNTELFVGKPLTSTCPHTGTTLCFDPVAYFATAATTSSGVDCPNVDTVLFHGFPQSLEDLLQCSGRCGRGPQASAATSLFCMVVSLNSLISLMTRIFILSRYDKESTSQDKQSVPNSVELLDTDALIRRQWQNVLRVLSIVCLDDGQCVHFLLEKSMVHPHKTTICDMPVTCDGACWRCRKPRISTPLDAPIHHEAFKRYLVMIFITAKLPPSRLQLHKDVFLNEMLNYETVDSNGKTVKAFAKSVLGVTSKQSVRQRTKALILKCFCAGILEPEIDGLKLCAKLGYLPNGNPRLNDPEAWKGFKSIPNTNSI